MIVGDFDVDFVWVVVGGDRSVFEVLLWWYYDCIYGLVW